MTQSALSDAGRTGGAAAELDRFAVDLHQAAVTVERTASALRRVIAIVRGIIPIVGALVAMVAIGALVRRVGRAGPLRPERGRIPASAASASG